MALTEKDQKRRIQLLEDAKRNLNEGHQRWQQELDCYRQQCATHVAFTKALTVGMPVDQLVWWHQFATEEPFKNIYDPYKNYGLGSKQMTPTSEDLTYDSNRIAHVTHFLHIKSVEHLSTPCWFSLSKGLLWGLHNTELKETYVEHVRMPFPSFFIALPPGCIYLNDKLTGLHEARYIGVTEGFEPVWGRALCIAVFCQPNENSVAITDDHVMDIWLPLFEEQQPLENVVDLVEFLGDALLDLAKKRGIDTTRRKLTNEEIEEILDDIKQRVQSGEKPREEFISHHFGCVFDEEYRNIRELKRIMLRIVTNTILYLNSVSAHKQHVHEEQIEQLKVKANKLKKGAAMQRIRVMKHIEELSKIPEWLLGTNITIDPEAQLSMSQRTPGSSESPGRRLKAPSITRGHWRHQAHGPRHSLRKLIWIAPFIRGRELGGDLYGHKYDIKP